MTIRQILQELTTSVSTGPEVIRMEMDMDVNYLNPNTSKLGKIVRRNLPKEDMLGFMKKVKKKKKKEKK